MQHPSQGAFARRSYGSFDAVSSAYAASATPYSPNSSSGSPMMQGYHQMQAADGLPIGHMSMEQAQHSLSNLSQQNSVQPPHQLPLHPHHNQHQHQQQQQQQMSVPMNPYLHQHPGPNGPPNHPQINTGTPYTQSPVEIHTPSHMQPPPPSTPAGSARQSIASSTEHEAAVNAASAAHHAAQPTLHRAQTHPGIGGPWSAPTPRISREAHHTMPMMHPQQQQQQQQMAMHMQRHPQGIPPPGYGHPYPQQQQHPSQSPIHQAPPQYGMPMQMHQPGLKLLDSYLLARAIQHATPQNEAQQIVLFAQANHRHPGPLLRAYEQNRREIDELVAQLREEDAAVTSMVTHQMSMSPSPMGMGMHSSQGMNGQLYPHSHMPPSIVSLQPHSVVPLSPTKVPLQPPNGHSMHPPSLPSSAPTSFQRIPSTGASELDMPSSEASSPMLETPTSASLPSGTSKGGSVMSVGMNGGSTPIASSTNLTINVPTSGTTMGDPPFVHVPSKPGSRDGEPYSQSEIQLIEWVIREAIQSQPDIKLAQLGVLIHAKDPGRPATAWARQLSKRKNAIERAREVVRQGGDVREWVFEVNGRGSVNVAHMLAGLGDGSGLIKEEDASEEESLRTRRAKREEDDDAEYGERPSKRRRGS